MREHQGHAWFLPSLINRWLGRNQVVARHYRCSISHGRRSSNSCSMRGRSSWRRRKEAEGGRRGGGVGEVGVAIATAVAEGAVLAAIAVVAVLSEIEVLAALAAVGVVAELPSSSQKQQPSLLEDLDKQVCTYEPSAPCRPWCIMVSRAASNMWRGTFSKQKDCGHSSFSYVPSLHGCCATGVLVVITRRLQLLLRQSIAACLTSFLKFSVPGRKLADRCGNALPSMVSIRLNRHF